MKTTCINVQLENHNSEEAGSTLYTVSFPFYRKIDVTFAPVGENSRILYSKVNYIEGKFVTIDVELTDDAHCEVLIYSQDQLNSKTNRNYLFGLNQYACDRDEFDCALAAVIGLANKAKNIGEE